MNNIDVIVKADVLNHKEKYIPMFSIPQGNVRFTNCHLEDGNKDGDYVWVVSESDMKVDIKKTYSGDELWANQNVEPIFAIRFESIEQIEAYIKCFNELLNYAKTFEATE